MNKEFLDSGVGYTHSDKAKVLKTMPQSSSDPVELVNPDGSSWFMSGIILANIILGMGLLNMPEAFRDAGGVVNALLTETVCMFFLVAGYILIVRCSDVYDATTYQSMVKSHGGRWALILCSVVIFVHNFGTCITFLVLLSDQLDEIMSFTFGSLYCTSWFLKRSFTMPVCSIVGILPFCFADRIDGWKLKIISAVGVLATGYIIVLVMLKYFHAEEVAEVTWSSSRWTDTLGAVPVICFSFEGHVEAVPLYASLQKRNIKEFIKVILVSTTLSLIVYTSVGMFGYLAKGSDVTSDIMLAYYPPDTIVIVGTFIVALKSVTTYPGVFFCARIVTDDLTTYCCARTGLSTKHRRMLAGTVFFLLSVAIALLVPTIGSVIKLLGGSAAFFIMVFPGLCYMKMHTNSNDKHRLLKQGFGVFMTVVGIFLATASTVHSIQIYMAKDHYSERHMC